MSDAGELLNRTTSFFDIAANQTQENHFYHFGLLFESTHYERNEFWRKNIHTPTREKFRGSVPFELIVAVQLGKDQNYEYDEAEADQFDSFYWSITRAIQFERPDWSYFYFFGGMQGKLNGEMITAERFCQYLSLFPESVLSRYQGNLLELFEHFNETEWRLSITDAGPVLG